MMHFSGWRRAGAGLALVAMLVDAGGTAVAAGDGDEAEGMRMHPALRAADWDATTEIVLELGDHTYVPDEIEMRVGKPYKIVLKNTGDVSHDMVGGSLFDEQAVALRMISSKVGRVISDRVRSIYVRKGYDTELWLVPLKAGEYTFFCSLPGHRDEGMEGVVRVVP